MNKFIKIIALIIISFVLVMPSWAENKPIKLAIVNLDAHGVSQMIANSLAEVLRNTFVNYKEFDVIEYSKMEEILKTQAFQQTGCSDTECAVEIGKILNAEKILLGSINAIGKKYIITLRLVDVKLGKIEIAHTQEDICELEHLTALVNNAGLGIISKITGKAPAVTPSPEIKAPLKVTEEEKKPTVLKKTVREGAKTRGKAFARSIFLPGWGQFYKKHYIKGTLILVAQSVTIAGTIAKNKNYEEKKEEYEKAYKKYQNAPPGTSQPEFNKLRQNTSELFKEQEDAYINSKDPKILGAIIYTFNLIDSLLGFPLPEDIIYTTENDLKDWDISLSLSALKPSFTITKNF